MLVAILLCGLAAQVAAQTQPCTTPPQLEARIMRFDSMQTATCSLRSAKTVEKESDYSKNFTQYAKFSYDATNKRIREIEELEFGSDRVFYDTLYLHNLNKEYKLDLKTRKCNVSVLTRPFRPAGLPPNARYDGSANVGPVNIPSEHVTIISFHADLGNNETIHGAVTTPDCIPVNDAYHSEKTGWVHTSFFDVTMGIPDPTVFDPPSECMG